MATRNTPLATFMDNAINKDLSTINDTSRGLIMTVRAIGLETGEELRSCFDDGITSALMFNKGTAPFSLLWSGKRKFLADRDIPLHNHQRHRTINTVTNTIYVDRSKNGTAIGYAQKNFERRNSKWESFNQAQAVTQKKAHVNPTEPFTT